MLWFQYTLFFGSDEKILILNIPSLQVFSCGKNMKRILGLFRFCICRQPSSASLMSDAQIALNYTHEREQRRNTTQNQNPQSESQNWHINQSHTESGSADTVQNQTEAFLAEHQNRLLGETVRSMSHEHESSIFEDQDSDAQSMQNNLSTPRGSYQDSSLAGKKLY